MGLLVRFPAGNTMNHLLGLLLLAAASQALPAPEPQFGFGHPLLYHAPNCTTEEDTITTKACKPVTENVCEDVEIPGSKIEYVDNCCRQCCHDLHECPESRGEGTRQENC